MVILKLSANCWQESLPKVIRSWRHQIANKSGYNYYNSSNDTILSNAYASNKTHVLSGEFIKLRLKEKIYFTLNVIVVYVLSKDSE